MTADRPRDRLGRPLPRGADPSPATPAVPSIAGLDDRAIWDLAVGFIDDGLPFHAHEVFEERWRTAAPADRDAWRALAQWGAALTHEARGNRVGAGRLAQRAQATLSGADSVPPVVDRARVLASCRALDAASG